MKYPNKFVATAVALAVSATLPALTMAQDADNSMVQDANESIEEVTVTGTRTKPRTATQSPVAIDSFNQSQLSQQPVGDMTESLRNLVPSFQATPLTGDGSSFVRSTSLRGLPPDEVLILINSKRRHRSSLIQHFGAAMSQGSHAADMGAIPSLALKNVEVLRDGAAAQYGSDAIAGVINFIYKDYDEGGTVEAQYGEYFDGEQSIKVGANVGFKLGSEGFMNLTAEYTDNEQLIRGFQPAAAQAAIDAGAQNVGTDSPYSGDTLAQTWGRPENSGLRTVFNMGVPFGDSAEWYLFGNYSDVEGNYRFFYRDPNHSSLQPMPSDPNDAGSAPFCWCDTLTGGYTPYLIGEQTDLQTVTGIRGDFGNDMTYDVSLNYGQNSMDYTLYNTLSPTYGPTSQRDFHPGDLEERDINFNADFTMPIGSDGAFGFGFEWREETYEMFAGDDQSYVPGPWAQVGLLPDPNDPPNNFATPPNGSNGMAGTPAGSAGAWDRDNYAVYGDFEWDFTDEFMMQVALRFEDYSDFGTTTNGKVAARWNVSQDWTLRGAVSTGFRAPTPGQSNLETIVTTFDTTSGLQTNEGTLRPTDPLLIPLGGAPLVAEDAFNLSFGVTGNITDTFTITADVYQVNVDERIVKTFNIDVSNDPDFAGSGFSSVAFYTNGLETETTGFDLVALWNIDWAGGSTTTFSLAYNHNDTEVTGQNQVNGVDPVTDDTIFNIENNLPNDRVSFAYNHYWDKFSLFARFNWYGETADERNEHETVDAAVMVDLEGRYNFTEQFTMVLGANNVFDEYPTEVDTRLGNGLAYPRRTPVGYDGGMWYLKGIYNW